MRKRDPRTTTTRQAMGTRLWAKCRVNQALSHLHRCPECGTWPDSQWKSAAPRWDADPVVALLGKRDGHCGRCGAEHTQTGRRD